MNPPRDVEYFIGLMSGTSTDGVDAVLVCFDFNQSLPHVESHVSLPMPSTLRHQILSLNRAGANEIERSYLCANQLVRLYAQACQQLLTLSEVHPKQIRAIGAHGQTVRHRPDLGFTVQLNAPALLAQLTGIDVVADFRSRDVAAGGQGAPFAPLLHQALFEDQRTRVVLNLGGIANITILQAGQPLLGFDTGPANVLMDLWAQMHLQQAYDADGAWGASGVVKPAILQAMLSQEPYFHLPAPKSTGRDLFNASWLNHYIERAESIAAVDMMATLRALTSHSVAQAIQTSGVQPDELIVCGGGARNLALMDELASLLDCPVNPIETYGIDSQAVEGLAFAWLARAFVQRQRLNLSHVTGAKNASIAGALYPA